MYPKDFWCWDKRFKAHGGNGPQVPRLCFGNGTEKNRKTQPGMELIMSSWYRVNSPKSERMFWCSKLWNCRWFPKRSTRWWNNSILSQGWFSISCYTTLPSKREKRISVWSSTGPLADSTMLFGLIQRRHTLGTSPSSRLDSHWTKTWFHLWEKELGFMNINPVELENCCRREPLRNRTIYGYRHTVPPMRRVGAT